MDKEETIFDAALKIITNKGFHKARMSDIAKQAGISYGLIYNYFKHKRVDLLGASVNPGCLNFPVVHRRSPAGSWLGPVGRTPAVTRNEDPPSLTAVAKAMAVRKRRRGR
ncbi:MAG: helix-turn-helix transcriptional regulator [Deltaproteobacteria bacterium]|nr:helix-turn-helix transcriptional regulator [Deltaproteobacteria bacterium]